MLSTNNTYGYIYRSIIRQLGITLKESEHYSKENTEGGKISAGVKVGIGGLFEANLNSEETGEDKINRSTVNKHLNYNLELAQDVSEILKTNGVDKYIVLENFHYLSLEVQEKLAYDLRVFQDQQIIFIILGIWREANRLAQFNGDLLDRVTEVPVEPWDGTDFLRVIEKGEGLLNVDFSSIKNNIIDAAYDSIGVVQEICKQCCLVAGITETQDHIVTLSQDHLNEALRLKSNEYGVRHQRNFESFISITKKVSSRSGEPSLAFPYYFIKVLLTYNLDNIETGLSRGALLEEIRKIHHRKPEDVRSSDLGSFLHNITQYQISKKINPPFADYDRASKLLKIIDSSLYFYLRNCDRAEMLSELENPLGLK